MKFIDNGKKVTDLKIAYVGGGSRGWARGLMSDLAQSERMTGTVYLYDIDFAAAKANETIGNGIYDREDVIGKWHYKAVKTLEEALDGANFVVISILPGTFDEMASDVHLPEQYGIYQSVGDSVGPGGIVRALRTIPMYKVIAEGIAKCCPDAWVINYTNPMSLCTAALYAYFPKIKAFGCCHEVFGTQKILGLAYQEKYGKFLEREDVNINVLGVNHFTWITAAHYHDEDLMPVYKEFVDKHYEEGYIVDSSTHWMNNTFVSAERVKFDLFKRYGVIAAAGDRHLAEFCPGDWYLKDPETVKFWKFGLTTVDWRRKDLKEKIEKTERLLAGTEKFEIRVTGEEGVRQMEAILGLRSLVTNVNLPNQGQIPDLPLGVVVETNAVFSPRGVQPVCAGPLPKGVDALVRRVVYEQQLTLEAAITGDYELAYRAFVNDANVNLPLDKSRELFTQMLKNTAKYLPDYAPAYVRSK
ncbi:MAG: alpha-glucosidase/alpha-galactosidase [Clostridia bacterium]|nr:alpha-glucosidase/alpha-galactosidase [Clostridia bacterium]